MALTIREYRSSDLERCRELWTELTEHHKEIYGEPTIGGDDPASGLVTYLADRRRTVSWVAEWDGSVVGLCGLLVAGKEAEVEPVIVSREHRSKGIGRTLLDHAKEEARRRGIRTLSIRPVARNARAIACFHEAGFRTLGHIEMFQSLEPGEGREWQVGLRIHDREFQY